MKYLYLVNKDILKLVLEPWLLILLGMCVFSVHDFDFLIRKKSYSKRILILPVSRHQQPKENPKKLSNVTSRVKLFQKSHFIEVYQLFLS